MMSHSQEANIWKYFTGLLFINCLLADLNIPRCQTAEYDSGYYAAKFVGNPVKIIKFDVSAYDKKGIEYMRLTDPMLCAQYCADLHNCVSAIFDSESSTETSCTLMDTTINKSWKLFRPSHTHYKQPKKNTFVYMHNIKCVQLFYPILFTIYLKYVLLFLSVICILSSNPSNYHVVLGSHFIGAGTISKLKSFAIHPLFGKVFKRAFDIAVITLEKNVTLSQEINILCLPTVYMGSSRTCVTAGWGRVREGGSANPVLQEAALPILSNGICNDYFHYRGQIHATMLCAGFEQGGRDACQGDSGGPLMCVQGGKWELHGIVSWGYGCGRPRRPGVYTRVFSFIGWVRTAIIKLEAENRRG